jgi:hypothetical protein
MSIADLYFPAASGNITQLVLLEEMSRFTLFRTLPENQGEPLDSPGN